MDIVLLVAGVHCQWLVLTMMFLSHIFIMFLIYLAYSINLLFFKFQQAMDILHSKGTKCVVITSSELGKDDTLIALGSSYNFETSGTCNLPF